MTARAANTAATATATAAAPSSARVLVVGDSMLDRYWDGAVDRVSPEAPVLVLRVEREFDRAGGAANVALNLVELGGAVTLATLLGRDPAGTQLAALVRARGVELAAVSDDALKTIEKIRSVSRRHQLLRIDFEQAPPAASVAALHERVAALLPEHPWVVLSDYAKGSLARAPELIAACLGAGCRVLVDPKGRDFTRYRGAWLVKPNTAEVRAIVGDWAGEDDLLAKLHALRADIGTEHLLMTRGEAGMTLVSADGACLQVPTAAREVYDVSGAGDTVLATLAHCLAAGRPLEDAVRWANRAAGIVVGKFGTASVTRAELGLDAGPGDGGDGDGDDPAACSDPAAWPAGAHAGAAPVSSPASSSSSPSSSSPSSSSSPPAPAVPAARKNRKEDLP